MIQLHQTESTMLHPESIHVQSPLCIFDPYDDTQEDINAVTEINVKHGEWMTYSGLYRDKHSKQQWMLRIYALETALKMMNLVTKPKDLDFYKKMSCAHTEYSGSKFSDLEKIHANNTVMLNLLDLVAKGQPFPVSAQEDLDLIKYRIFAKALNYVADHPLKTEYLIFELTAQAQGKSQEEIEAYQLNEIQAVIEDLNKKLKVEIDEAQNHYLCNVQYLHLKHKSWPIFSPLHFVSWETAQDHYTSSGQVALATKAWLENNHDDLACQIERLTKEYIEDGTRSPLNKKKVGASEFGAACVTPERESSNSVYVMRNDAGEIVELLIHFDLADLSDDD